MEVIAYGADSNRNVIPLLVDSNGRVILGAGISAYSGQILRRTIVGLLVAGTNTLFIGAVPINTVWVFTNIAIRYTGTPAGVSMYVSIWDGTNAFSIYTVKAPVSAIDVDRQGQWALDAGDSLRLDISNAIANDDGRIYATGYSFSIV